MFYLKVDENTFLNSVILTIQYGVTMNIHEYARRQLLREKIDAVNKFLTTEERKHLLTTLIEILGDGIDKYKQDYHQMNDFHCRVLTLIGIVLKNHGFDAFLDIVDLTPDERQKIIEFSQELLTDVINERTKLVRCDLCKGFGLLSGFWEEPESLSNKRCWICNGSGWVSTDAVPFSTTPDLTYLVSFEEKYRSSKILFVTTDTDNLKAHVEKHLGARIKTMRKRDEDAKYCYVYNIQLTNYTEGYLRVEPIRSIKKGDQ